MAEPATPEARALERGALLANVEEAATAVLVLTEGLEEAEFLGSRLTRRAVRGHLDVITASLAALEKTLRGEMPELEWDGWAVAARRMVAGGDEGDAALWFAVVSLTPATLLWLRIHRGNKPQLFSFTA